MGHHMIFVSFSVLRVKLSSLVLGSSHDLFRAFFRVLRVNLSC